MSKSATVVKRLKDFPNDSLTKNASGFCYCTACNHRFKICDLTTVRRHCMQSASHKENLAKWNEQQMGAVVRSGQRTLRGFTVESTEASRVLALLSVTCDFSPQQAEPIRMAKRAREVVVEHEDVDAPEMQVHELPDEM